MSKATEPAVVITVAILLNVSAAETPRWGRTSV
jgi:hypothetical protein